MGIVEVTLTILIEFYTQIWVQNPHRFPTLKNKFTEENLKTHIKRKTVKDDLVSVISNYIRFYYEIDIDKNLGYGNSANLNRFLEKLMKQPISIKLKTIDNGDKEYTCSNTECQRMEQTIKENENLIKQLKAENEEQKMELTKLRTQAARRNEDTLYEKHSLAWIFVAVTAFQPFSYFRFKKG